MVCDKVVDLRMEISKNLRRGRDESGLVAVAASEVLRGDNRDGISGLGFYQQNLAVIVREIGSLDNLGDERPEFERLVRGLMVENKVDACNFFVLSDEKEPSQKFLGDRERSLPNLGYAYLRQYPFEDVGHLDGITQIRLKRSI